MEKFKGTFRKSTTMAIGGEIMPYELAGANGVVVELYTRDLENFNPNQFLNHQVGIEGYYEQRGVERKRNVFNVRSIKFLSV